MLRGALALAILLLAPTGAMAAADAPLALEAKIPLGAVSGRIDHLAIDLKRQRLFVAQLGNDSLGVVDLATRKLQRTIAGFKEPQGVGYEASTDTIYVANAGDGSVRVSRGKDLAPIARIDLGDDADNVRIDAERKRVLVGYGKGALAVIDPASQTMTADIRLKGHPEGFQIGGTQAFVNVPDVREIQIVDLATGASRSVPTAGARANFPMAIDRDAQRVLVIFRSPPTLMAFSSQDGTIAAKIETCGDADDVFVDPKRHRVYVSCGAGVVDVLEPSGAGYWRLAQVPTVSGARTSLFVPELDRLFVAVRAQATNSGAFYRWRAHPLPAAKAAIAHYTRYLAQDLGPFGITANCIAPGVIATGRIMATVIPGSRQSNRDRSELVTLRRLKIDKFMQPLLPVRAPPRSV